MQESVFDRVVEEGIKANLVGEDLLADENIEDTLKKLDKKTLETILKAIYKEFSY